MIVGALLRAYQTSDLLPSLHSEYMKVHALFPEMIGRYLPHCEHHNYCVPRENEANIQYQHDLQPMLACRVNHIHIVCVTALVGCFVVGSLIPPITTLSRLENPNLSLSFGRGAMTLGFGMAFSAILSVFVEHNCAPADRERRSFAKNLIGYSLCGLIATLPLILLGMHITNLESPDKLKYLRLIGSVKAARAIGVYLLFCLTTATAVGTQIMLSMLTNNARRGRL